MRCGLNERVIGTRLQQCVSREWYAPGGTTFFGRHNIFLCFWSRGALQQFIRKEKSTKMNYSRQRTPRLNAIRALAFRFSYRPVRPRDVT